MYNKKKTIHPYLFSRMPSLPFCISLFKQLAPRCSSHVVSVLDACDGFGDRLSHSGPQRFGEGWCIGRSFGCKYEAKVTQRSLIWFLDETEDGRIEHGKILCKILQRSKEVERLTPLIHKIRKQRDKHLYLVPKSPRASWRCSWPSDFKAPNNFFGRVVMGLVQVK